MEPECIPTDTKICGRGDLVIYATTCMMSEEDEMRDIIVEKCDEILKRAQKLRHGKSVKIYSSAWRGGGEELRLENMEGEIRLVYYAYDEDFAIRVVEVLAVVRKQ